MLKNNPDAIINTVFATGNNVPADGTSMVSITAQVTDSTGTIPLSGQSVVFNATRGTVISSPVATDTSGLATTTITSTTAGISSVTASVNSNSGHVDITFTEATLSPVISSLISDKDSIVSDGVDKAILTVTVTNSSTGSPVIGANIAWTTDIGTIEPSGSVSNADGQAVTALTDNGDTGTATVTATLTAGNTITGKSMVNAVLESNGEIATTQVNILPHVSSFLETFNSSKSFGDLTYFTLSGAGVDYYTESRYSSYEKMVRVKNNETARMDMKLPLKDVSFDILDLDNDTGGETIFIRYYDLNGGLMATKTHNRAGNDNNGFRHNYESYTAPNGKSISSVTLTLSGGMWIYFDNVHGTYVD